MTTLQGPSPTARGVVTHTWRALGTSAVLCINGGGDPAVRAAVEREIDDIDLAASRFRGDSELSALNRAGGRWCQVSPLLLEAVSLAIRAAVVSGGAVDPTLGESLVAAGYDRDWAELTPLSRDAPIVAPRRIRIARRRRELWRLIGVRGDPPAVQVPDGVSLDLGATAKALAADRAARAGHLAGGDGVLVALGGDIATAGRAPAGGWPVHVTDDHRDGPEAPGQGIAIHDGGVATSSVTGRRWLHRGEPMHHLLDPRTGHPVRPIWRTASVAAGSCADANIAATAAIVLGDNAPSWLREHGLPARLVAVDGTVEVQGEWPP